MPSAHTQPPAGQTAKARSANMSPIKPQDFGYEQARHLLWRAGFGGTPQQIQTLASWGPTKAVDYLLSPEQVEFEKVKADLFDKDIMAPPSAEQRQMYREAQKAGDEDALAKVRLMRQERERLDRRQIAEVQKWWLKRMVETPRPLEEKMTLFWHGHFATSYRTIENSYHMFLQNELFRTHAVGRFDELLHGIIRDPAMLAYLDNNDSRKGKPNENLAREIMELFALGIGAYGEKDIKEGARALTGYTFQDDTFQFQKSNHDDGVKTILGRSGKWNGVDFVNIILAQPACAMFIARKLYGFFAEELPPTERMSDRELPPAAGQAVRTLAGTLSKGWDLRETLRQLFLSEHFYSARLMGQQIKSPAVLIVGAIRSLNAPARDLSILNDAMDLMGQNILFPPSVKGWEGGRSWINTSTMFVRQNILAYLLTGKKPVGYDATADMMKYDPLPLLDELKKADAAADQDPGRVIDYLLKLCLGHNASYAREPLVEFVNSRGGSLTPDLVTGLLLLITAMPDYQLC